MSTIINQKYNQFYKGMESLKNYSSNDSLKKDTLVRYEFNTHDEQGNKIMDKMSKEETIQVMKEIREQYGDNVIVEFSGDGMAALVESRKGSAKGNLSEEAAAVKNADFQKEIVQIDKSADYLPAYSGIILCESSGAGTGFSRKYSRSTNKRTGRIRRLFLQSKGNLYEIISKMQADGRTTCTA